MNTNTIKVVLAGMLLAASSAHAMTVTQEDLCIVYARTAQSAAKGMERGHSEEDMLSSIADNGSRANMTGRSIIGYVYTMQLSQKDARKLVYTKCMSGAYE